MSSILGLEMCSEIFKPTNVFEGNVGKDQKRYLGGTLDISALDALREGLMSIQFIPTAEDILPSPWKKNGSAKGAGTTRSDKDALKADREKIFKDAERLR